MAISEESIRLVPDYDGTLQQQIQHRVSEAILAGRFRPGERLPSSRRLARHLGVSRITVTLAYTELVASDYLTARGRSGYFVSESAPAPARPLAPRPPADGVDWGRAIGRRFSGYASLARPADWRRYRFPFIYGQADASLFDHQNWRLCALDALGQRNFEAMTADYYEADDPGLIDFIARSILPRRGVAAGPEQILLTLGAQNALWMAAQILLTQRRTAAMEHPSYPGLREILGQTRCNLVSVEVDGAGLDPARLPTGLDVVFCAPTRHCPTGAAMPEARRRALLDRAAAEGFVIVEDDYELALGAEGPPPPALKALDRAGAVVLVGSFSKTLFPGLRLGYLVAPEPVIREARALRAMVLRHPPGHLQRTLAYFMARGCYDAQVKRLRRAYARRAAAMEAAIATEGLVPVDPGVRGGPAYWMRAPEGVETGRLATRLAAEGVLIEPGGIFFAGPGAPGAFYRLSYGSIAEDRIPEGVARIAAAIGREAAGGAGPSV